MQDMLTRRFLLTSSLGILALGPRAHATTDDNPWSVAPSLPFAVQEIYPIVFQGRIVLAGGIIDDSRDRQTASAQTVIYEPEHAVWRDGPDLPTPLHHPGLLALPDRMLAIGGFATNAGGFWQMQNTVYVLDRDLSAWRDGPALPAPRVEFVAAYLQGAAIVVGGRTPAGRSNRHYGGHADVAETLLLDIQTNHWRRARPAPTARNSAAGAVLDGKFHVVGGRVVFARGIDNLATHEVYDPLTDSWSTRAPMPQAQGGLAAAALNGRLYAFGGEVFAPRRGIFDEVWAYDPTADRWHAKSSMPLPRHGLGAVALPDGIHLIGGATRAGAEGRSNRHDVFSPTKDDQGNGG